MDLNLAASQLCDVDRPLNFSELRFLHDFYCPWFTNSIGYDLELRLELNFFVDQQASYFSLTAISEILKSATDLKSYFPISLLHLC